MDIMLTKILFRFCVEGDVDVWVLEGFL